MGLDWRPTQLRTAPCIAKDKKGSCDGMDDNSMRIARTQQEVCSLTEVKKMKPQDWENTCVICQEAITNPICAGCLEGEILEWLSYRKPEMMGIFRKGAYYKDVDIGTNCIKCRSNISLCAHCFSRDVIELLTAHDPGLVEEFTGLFNFELKELQKGVT